VTTEDWEVICICAQMQEFGAIQLLNDMLYPRPRGEGL
jgi:hypothetical protein